MTISRTIQQAGLLCFPSSKCTLVLCIFVSVLCDLWYEVIKLCGSKQKGKSRDIVLSLHLPMLSPPLLLPIQSLLFFNATQSRPSMVDADYLCAGHLDFHIFEAYHLCISMLGEPFVSLMVTHIAPLPVKGVSASVCLSVRPTDSSPVLTVEEE